MTISIANQVYVFLYCIVAGLSIGLLFDVFRLSRKYIDTKDMVTYIEDIVFWFLVGGIVLVTVHLSNNGQLRGFVFLGIILGVVFYFLLLSKLLMKMLSNVIEIMIKILEIIIRFVARPAKFVFKIIYSPIKYILMKVGTAKKISTKLMRVLRMYIERVCKNKKILKEKI